MSWVLFNNMQWWRWNDIVQDSRWSAAWQICLPNAKFNLL